MHEEIEGWVAELENREKGWVTRRDAAEFLGQAALKAVEALRAHTTEKDRDIREMSVRALGWAKAGLEGVAPVSAGRSYSLDDLVRPLEKPDSRSVTQIGDAYEVTVTLKEGRSQTLLVRHVTSRANLETIRISTICGKAKEKALAWALRNNGGMAQCALALEDVDGEEMLVMVNSFLVDGVTPDEMKSSVKEVAYYGDWVESKLTGGDEF